MTPVHSTYVDYVPVGMGHFEQAACTCGWRGTLGVSYTEARRELTRHRWDTCDLTPDVMAWLTGTGRFSQD